MVKNTILSYIYEIKRQYTECVDKICEKFKSDIASIHLPDADNYGLRIKIKDHVKNMGIIRNGIIEIVSHYDLVKLLQISKIHS